MEKVERIEVARMIDGMIYCHQWYNCRYGYCKNRKCALNPDDERLNLVMETIEKHNLTLDDFAKILEAYRRQFMRSRETEGTLMHDIRCICLSFGMEVAKLGIITTRVCPSA